MCACLWIYWCAGTPHFSFLFDFVCSAWCLLLLLLPYHVVSHRAPGSRALYFVAATVQQQSHNKFAWTTSMRVLALHMRVYAVIRSKIIIPGSRSILPGPIFFKYNSSPCSHVSSNISCDQSLLCYLRVSVQLTSLPGFHVTHIPKGDLVCMYPGGRRDDVPVATAFPQKADTGVQL